MKKDGDFDAAIHLLTPVATAEQALVIGDFRRELQAKLPKLYNEFAFWLTDAMLQRFLIARQYDVVKSLAMMKQALIWRAERNPDRFFRPVPEPADLLQFEQEIATGKTYIAGFDRHGRVVIVFDNSVQNTHNHETQIAFLSFVLELAIQLSPANRDKYVIFMHLTAFSFFNCPPMRTTIETCKMLVTCLPERLGHCICFHPPSVFHTVFHTLKPFIDKRTTSKLCFISGSTADGSANDVLMTDIIGKHWKVLTGADQPVLKAGSSPGYNHDVVWAQHLQHLETIRPKMVAVMARAGAAEKGAELSIDVPPPSPSSSSSSSSSSSGRDDWRNVGTPASAFLESKRSSGSNGGIAEQSIAHRQPSHAASLVPDSPTDTSLSSTRSRSLSSRKKDARTLALCLVALVASAAAALLLYWQGAHASEGVVVGTVTLLCCLIFMRTEA